MEEMYGNIFSETGSSRAVLFKEGFKNATNLESILLLMRQNNLTEANSTAGDNNCAGDIHCILSEEGYWSVVGARGDIGNIHKEAYGVIDTKVVSGKLLMSMSLLVLSLSHKYIHFHNFLTIEKGPTAGHRPLNMQ